MAFTVPCSCLHAGQAKDLTTYLAAWQAQDSAIVTAHFQVRLHRLPRGQEKAAPTRKEIMDILSNPDLDKFSVTLQKLKAALPINPQVTVPFWDLPVEIWQDDLRISSSMPLNIPGKRQGSIRRVFSGKADTEYNSFNRQANLYAGKSHIALIDKNDLCFLPYPLTPDRFGQPRPSPEKGKVIIDRGPVQLECDSETGQIAHVTRKRVDGQIDKEVFQFGFRTYPGGIAIPQVSVHLEYDPKSNPSLLTVYVLEKAEFNIELAADAFKVPVPKGTNILDLRFDPNQPSVRRISKPIDDLVPLADSLLPLENTPPSPPKSSPLKIWFSALVGCLMLLLWTVARFYGKRGVMPTEQAE
jgi:hypothetical protein